MWRNCATSVETLLGLLLGGFLGFALTGLQNFLDRNRRKKSLASALLTELRTLEHQLSLRYEDEAAAESGGTITTPVFDRFSTDVLLLRHDRLYPVLQLYGFVADVKLHLKSARDRAHEWQTLKPIDNQRVRLKSYFALSTIASAKKALEESGGVLPDRLFNHGTYVEALPSAPAKSFENYPDDS